MLNRVFFSLALTVAMGGGLLIGMVIRPAAWAQKPNVSTVSSTVRTDDPSYGEIGPTYGTMSPGVPMYGYAVPPRWQVLIIPAPNSRQGITLLLDSLTGDTYYLEYGNRFYWSHLTR
ncbi:MAG TPA: hypothetical protein VHV83_06085 [Armatimonadota bacterium]|nr:hypothetical protein [Armatimonadota bacterium]